MEQNNSITQDNGHLDPKDAEKRKEDQAIGSLLVY